jgi:hypothetical protein
MAKYFIRTENLPSNKEHIHYVIEKDNHFGKVKFRVMESFMERKNAKNYKKALVKKDRTFRKGLRSARRARAKTLRKMKRNGEL